MFHFSTVNNRIRLQHILALKPTKKPLTKKNEPVATNLLNNLKITGPNTKLGSN